jgi:hypothetical protein
VKLHPKLKQDISECRLGRHPKPRCEKLLEDHSFIICRVRNDLLSRRSCITFDEVPKGGHLIDMANCDSRRPEKVAVRGLARIRDSTLLILRSGGAFVPSVGAVVYRQAIDMLLLAPHFCRNFSSNSLNHLLHGRAFTSHRIKN